MIDHLSFRLSALRADDESVQRARRYLRNLVAIWLAIEAIMGVGVAVGLAVDERYTEAVVVLVLVAVFIWISWRLAHRRKTA